MTWRIKNWKKFQHFKDRRPPWIKLYRDLLDDVEWFNLDGDSAKSLIMVWLIASEDNGNIPPTKELAWRLRITDERLTSILENLAHWIEPGENEDICDWHSRYVPKQLKSEVLQRAEFKCVACGSRKNLEIDHIIPISKGGTGDESNLQALCRSCNRRKRMRSHNYADATQTPSPETETETERERDAVSPTAHLKIVPEKKPESKVSANYGASQERALFDRGKEICGANANGLIAKLLKSKGNVVALARAALEVAATKQNPREYIGAIIRGQDDEGGGIREVIVNGRRSYSW